MIPLVVLAGDGGANVAAVVEADPSQDFAEKKNKKKNEVGAEKNKGKMKIQEQSSCEWDKTLTMVSTKGGYMHYCREHTSGDVDFPRDNQSITRERIGDRCSLD